jgi:hypothetical protein
MVLNSPERIGEGWAIPGRARPHERLGTPSDQEPRFRQQSFFSLIKLILDESFLVREYDYVSRSNPVYN